MSTTPAPARAPAADTPAATSVDPTVADRVRRQRLVAGAVLLVLVVVGLLAWAGGRRGEGYLDPVGVDPGGSRALARVLEGQGVEVVRLDRADAVADALRAAPAATLLVTTPQLVSDRMAAAVGAAPVTHVVSITSTPEPAGPWSPVTTVTALPVQVRDPACDWPAAVRAGPATTGGAQLSGGEGALACYAASVLDLPAGAGHAATTVLGTGATLTNAELAEQGNAALATAALGRDPVLVWWLPSIADPLFGADGEAPSLTSLLPAWVPWALLQLAIGVLVLALVRGRRFGPVVTEPLPVTVRAAETTEGLARMYRRSHGRTHAAGLLAQEATVRLGGSLGLPRGSDPGTVAREVAARTGRPPAEVLDLLAHPAPPDDAALVRFAHDLDALERQVRHP